MCGLICGLNACSGWCDETVIDWHGNAVDSTRVSEDELLSFLSKMDVFLVVMESSGCVYPTYSCFL